MEEMRGELARARDARAHLEAELDQLIHVVSHDLREPLRMVTSFSELLSRRYAGQLDGRADEYIHYAVDGARRMEAFLDDLLILSRVRTRGEHFAPVACSQIVARATKALRGSLDAADVALTVTELPMVMGDAAQLELVFRHLLRNAIEFRGEAPPTVIVSAKRDEEFWRLSVRDNGIGIALKDRDRVFEIFQQLHARSEHPGTGIGLAIVRKVVERHGGRVWAESEQRAGITFSFTLPVAVGEP